MKHISFLVACFICAIVCVAQAKDKPPFEVLASGLDQTQSATLYRRITVFALNTVPGTKGEGYISRIHKEDVEVFYKGLIDPKAMVQDPRRALLFVTDQNKIKTIKIKQKEGESPNPEVTTIELPQTNPEKPGYLTGITFSIMNRMVYACDPISQTIWAYNPKKKTSKLLVSSEHFQKLNLGKPNSLLISNDGKRLYIGTTTRLDPDLKKAAILQFNVTKNTMEVLHQLTELRHVSGLEIYKKHFLVSDGESGQLWAMPMKKGKEPAKLMVPEGTFHRPGKLHVMGSDAYIPDSKADPKSGRVVRLSLSLNKSK